jgi:acyl-CoA thioesterase FadM
VADFVACGSGVVLPEWIDGNGHMNMSHHLAVVDKAVDRLFDSVGMGPERLASEGWALAASRAQLSFRAELREGEPYDVVCGVAARGPQGVTVVCRIRSAGTLRSVCELLIAAMDRTQRRRRILDGTDLVRAAAAVVPGLRTPFDEMTGAPQAPQRGTSA